MHSTRFRAAIAAQATGESRVCVCGDMNVAHEDVDFHNPAERRTLTQAGTTPEERASLRCFLEPPLGMRDAFRQVHGRAAGQYTYWSQRARARPANRSRRRATSAGDARERPLPHLARARPRAAVTAPSSRIKRITILCVRFWT